MVVGQRRYWASSSSYLRESALGEDTVDKSLAILLSSDPDEGGLFVCPILVARSSVFPKGRVNDRRQGSGQKSHQQGGQQRKRRSDGSSQVRESTRGDIVDNGWRLSRWLAVAVVEIVMVVVAA